MRRAAVTRLIPARRRLSRRGDPDAEERVRHPSRLRLERGLHLEELLQSALPRRDALRIGLEHEQAEGKIVEPPRLFHQRPRGRGGVCFCRKERRDYVLRPPGRSPRGLAQEAPRRAPTEPPTGFEFSPRQRLGRRRRGTASALRAVRRGRLHGRSFRSLARRRIAPRLRLRSRARPRARRTARRLRRASSGLERSLHERGDARSAHERPGTILSSAPGQGDARDRPRVPVAGVRLQSTPVARPRRRTN